MPKQSAVHKVPVSLTAHQYKTLVKGGKIRLKKDQLSDGGEHVLHLTSSVKARKLNAAKSRQKGCEIALSPDEFRHTMEGEGFKDFSRKANRWFKKKAAPWLGKAAKSVWSGFKDATNVAKHAAYALTDGVAESIPAVAPVLAQGALAYYAPQTALGPALGGMSDFALGPPPMRRGYGMMKNPADNLEDNVDVGLFGIHHHTPDHVLMNNNSNFIASKHPAAQPTLLQHDPLSRLHLGSVISGTGVTHERGVHSALQPVYSNKQNLVNTPAFMTLAPTSALARVTTAGGSFAAAGYGFKPAGY